MRTMTFTLATLLLAALPAMLLAQEESGGGGGSSSLMTPDGGLMIWTLLIFIALWILLSKYAFGPITAAVEAREQALRDALAHATRDREEAARVLEKNREQIEGARTEANRLIAEGRSVGEKMQAEMLEETRVQQQAMLERARRDIDTEKEKAISQLRREAVDLAIAGASRVIEENLDGDANRRIVESFLSDIARGKSAGEAGGSEKRGARVAR